MNQLDLILENIRLGHINALLLEAKTEDEIVRGVNLINESMQLLASSMLEEADRPFGPLSKVKPVTSNNQISQATVDSYQKNFVNPSINARNTLAGEIKGLRQKRDLFNSSGKNGASYDNAARFKSAMDGQSLIDQIKRQPVDKQSFMAEKLRTQRLVKSYNPTDSNLATTRLAQGLDDKVTANTIRASSNPQFHIGVYNAQNN